MFDNIDFTNFWVESDYVKEFCTGEDLTDELLSVAEERLGYKLPASYIELMRTRNGAKPIKNIYFDEVTQYCVDVEKFYSISEDKLYSLFGELSNEFWFDEWGYPRDVGVIIADTVLAGHEMIYLDYRDCGRNGEPKVSICLQESDYEIIVLADTFEEFIVGLVSEEEFE